jgi:hypothetical protein
MIRLLRLLGYRQTIQVRYTVDAKLRHFEEHQFLWWVHPVLPRMRARAD